MPPSADGSGGRLDSDEAIWVLTFLRRLIVDKISPIDVTNAQEPETSQLFNAGKAVYMRGWNSAWVSMNSSGSAVIDKVGVAPLPTFHDKSSSYSTIGGWSLYVNPHTAKLDPVLAFIRWMTDIEAQSIMARYSTLPTNIDVRRDGKLQDDFPPLAAAAGKGRATPIARPAGTPNYPAVSKAIYSNVNMALRGSVTPEKALQRAEQEVREAFARPPD
jgi:multiple sugar transport system substrate-binding protein